MDLGFAAQKQEVVVSGIVSAHTPSDRLCSGLSLGCRGEATCRVLWSRIPQAYKGAHCFADIWDAYTLVVPQEQLTQSAKRGPINHLERFNHTLRGRLGRIVRQTSSFSKCLQMHEGAILLFLHRYNKELLST